MATTIPLVEKSKPISSCTRHQQYLGFETEVEFISAVLNGDLKILTEKINKDNVNTATSTGIMPLHFAVVAGRIEVLDFFMSLGASLKERIQLPAAFVCNCAFPYKYACRDKDTPLMTAIRNNLFKILKHFEEKYQFNLEQLNNASHDLSCLADSNFEMVHYVLQKTAKTDEERKKIVEKQDAEGKNLFLHGSTRKHLQYYLETLKVDVNQVSKYGKTILHYLWCFNARREVIKYLFETYLKTQEEKETLLNKKDNYGDTGFFGFSWVDFVFEDVRDDLEGSEEPNTGFTMLRYFIEELKVSPHLKASDGETILHSVTAHDSLETVQYLLEVFAKTDEERRTLLNAEDNYGRTAFHYSRHAPKVLHYYFKYIDNGLIDILQQDAEGDTILHLNSYNWEETSNPIESLLITYPKTKEQNEKITALLVKQDNDGNPPFIAAALHGDHALDIIKKFLATGKIDINQKNKKGQTILDVICDEIYEPKVVLDIIKYLFEEYKMTALQKTAILSAMPGSNPPSFLISEWDDLTTFRYFVEILKINIEQVFNNRTVFGYSVYNGCINIARYLLNIGARKPKDHSSYLQMINPKEGGYDEEFLSMLSAADEMWRIVEAGSFTIPQQITPLLEAGASVNQKDGSGSTPLHILAAQGKEQVVEFFLENGADPFLKDDNGATPFDLATAHRNITVIFLVHELKKKLTLNLNNKEEMERHKKDIEDSIKNIFILVEKTKDLQEKDKLYLALGRKFKELQLPDEAKKAFLKVSFSSHDSYRLAKGELAEFPVLELDETGKPLSQTKSNLSLDDTEQVEKEERLRDEKLIEQLTLLSKAGLDAAHLHPRDTSMLRTRTLNHFLGISTLTLTATTAAATTAAATTSAATLPASYPDYCTPEGIMFLIKTHARVLKENNHLLHEKKTMAEEMSVANSTIQKLTHNLAKKEGQIEGQEKVLTSILAKMDSLTKNSDPNASPNSDSVTPRKPHHGKKRKKVNEETTVVEPTLTLSSQQKPKAASSSSSAALATTAAAGTVTTAATALTFVAPVASKALGGDAPTTLLMGDSAAGNSGDSDVLERSAKHPKISNKH